MTNSDNKQLNNANPKTNNVCGNDLKMYALGTLVLGSILIPSFAADAINWDAMVTAMVDPPIAALKAHWGKGILISGGGSAILGGGDPRERAERAGKGAVFGAAVILGLIAGLG